MDDKKLPNGDIHASQPNAIQYVIKKADMDMANSKPTPYNTKTTLHGPTEDDEPLPKITKIYQQLLRDIRYIADSTRPDLLCRKPVSSCVQKAHSKALDRIKAPYPLPEAYPKPRTAPQSRKPQGNGSRYPQSPRIVQ